MFSVVVGISWLYLNINTFCMSMNGIITFMKIGHFCHDPQAKGWIFSDSPPVCGVAEFWSWPYKLWQI